MQKSGSGESITKDARIACNVSRVAGIRNVEMLITDEVPASIGHGSKRCTMLSGIAPDGAAVVIKAAISCDIGANEIENNISSYKLAEKLGVGCFFPRVVDYGKIPIVPKDTTGFGLDVLYPLDVVYLAMERAKTPFYRALGKVNSPDTVYDSLYTQLYSLYERTLQHDPRASLSFLEKRFDDLERYFGKHLPAAGLSGSEELGKVHLIRGLITPLRPKNVVLTTGGEIDVAHVFFSENGRLILIDPKPAKQMVGTPQTDLGIFATLAKTVYALKGGGYGYDKAKELARKAGRLQGIDERTSDLLFEVGEIRLLATSARFRVGVNDTQATLFSDMAKEKLNHVYYSLLERRS
jgi:hypothetical protein